MNRSMLSSLVVVALTLVGTGVPAAEPKIPVILDTDIGGDIDDTWALALSAEIA